MKTNQKIIFLTGVFILLIAIIIGIYFGIDKSSTIKNPSSDLNKNDTTDNANAIIIENELKKIISYLNNEDSLENLNNISCVMLSSDIGFDLNSNQDFFITYAAPIMECIYKYSYTHLNSNSFAEEIIISSAEQKTLNKYFSQDLGLKSFDEVFKNVEDDEISKYFNNDYKILAKYDDGPGIPSISYKISRIIKVNDIYEVTLIASQEKKEYIGTVRVNIVDNHCQFDKLIFKKATN